MTSDGSEDDPVRLALDEVWGLLDDPSEVSDETRETAMANHDLLWHGSLLHGRPEV